LEGKHFSERKGSDKEVKRRCFTLKHSDAIIQSFNHFVVTSSQSEKGRRRIDTNGKTRTVTVALNPLLILVRLCIFKKSLILLNPIALDYFIAFLV
jgi:hypothetical protein